MPCAKCARAQRCRNSDIALLNFSLASAAALSDIRAHTQACHSSSTIRLRGNVSRGTGGPLANAVCASTFDEDRAEQEMQAIRIAVAAAAHYSSLISIRSLQYNSGGGACPL